MPIAAGTKWRDERGDDWTCLACACGTVWLERRYETMPANVPNAPPCKVVAWNPTPLDVLCESWRFVPVANDVDGGER